MGFARERFESRGVALRSDLPASWLGLRALVAFTTNGPNDLVHDVSALPDTEDGCASENRGVETSDEGEKGLCVLFANSRPLEE